MRGPLGRRRRAHLEEWLNGWTLTYALACAVLLLATRAARRRSAPVRWRRVAAWLVFAAMFGLLTWSLLACLWLKLVEAPPSSWEWRMVPFCLLGSAYWATFVVGAFVPLYSLLLAWYARRFGSSENTRRSVLWAALALGLPGALWIAYAHAFPIYDLRRSVAEATTYGGLALVSFWVALAGPRLIVQRLGPGELTERVAA